MKFRGLTILLMIALCVAMAPFVSFAVPAELEAVTSDRSVILRSLVAFSKVKTYDLKGEITVSTDSVTLGEEIKDTQTAELTGVYADGKVTLQSDTLALIDPNSLDGLFAAVDRKMLNSYEVINEFEEDEVRYIDIAVFDYSDIGNYASELQSGLTQAIIGTADDDMAALFAEIIAPMLNSMKITGSEFFRVDTSKALIVGIGMELAIAADFELFDMPVSIDTQGEGFIDIIYPEPEIEVEAEIADEDEPAEP